MNIAAESLLDLAVNALGQTVYVKHVCSVRCLI